MERIKNYIYLLWVLVISNLHYQEMFGLNAFIVALVSIGVFGLMKKEYLKLPRWWVSSGIYALSGLAVFLQGGAFTLVLYFFSSMLFIGTQMFLKHSLFLGPLQAIHTWGLGVYYYFHNLFSITEREQTSRQKIVKNVLLILVPVLIAIVFLKLYQSADETFAEYTAWINLDWISWGFIGFYLVMTLVLYGLFYLKSEPTLMEWEKVLKNQISEDYDDGIQRVVGHKNEVKTAVALLIILNAFLLLYNFIDLRFVSTQLFSHDFDSSYSQVVHGGINSLIGSIVLVILLLTYMFRGQLNFKASPTLKILAAIWLAQNLVMISTTAIKNWEYVAHWGLTYKRIGVFVYLLLACVGIGFTLYKLFKAKSIWYLMRNTSLSFFTFFIVFSTFSWDGIIADFNLHNISKERIDFDYLLDLGDDALPALIAYHEKETLEDFYLEDLSYKASRELETLNHRRINTTWRSMNLSDYSLRHELAKWQLSYGEYRSLRSDGLSQRD